MLNELRSLVKGLEGADIQVRRRSPLMKPNKNQSGLRVWIGSNGGIERIDSLPSASVKQLRRYDKANGISFPTFNVGPFYDLPQEKRNDKQEEDFSLASLRRRLKKAESALDRLALFAEFKGRGVFLLNEGDFSRVRKCVYETPKVLTKWWGGTSERFSSISRLLEILSAKEWRGEEFVVALEEVALRGVIEGEVSSEIVVDLLFGKGCPILLEYDVGKGIHYPLITSFEMRDYLNDLLVSGTETTEGERLDAFTGQPCEPEMRYPGPTLPSLGRSYLLSCPRAVPCQSRYSLSEGHIFPVAKSIVCSLNDALEHIVDSSRKKRTWIAIRSEKRNKSDLLICYVERLADPGEFASLFGGSGDEARFEAVCEAVLETISKLRVNETDSVAQIFIIGKVDPGRRQVKAHRVCSLDELQAATEGWKIGFQNVGNIKIPLGSFAKQSLEIAVPPTLFPEQLLATINTHWTQGRDKWESDSTPTVTIREVLQLFFERPQAHCSLVTRILRNVVRQWDGIFSAVGNALHGGKLHAASDEMRRAVLNSSAVLGFLLFLLGRTKESYMNDTAYNLGRLLACGDQLHLLYCQHVRGGDVPPQLFGAALLRTALDRPLEVLNRFGERSVPYISWAKTYGYKDKDKEVGLVKFYLGQMQSLTPKLRDMPSTLSDSERAELFLGFMATFEGKVKSESARGEGK